MEKAGTDRMPAFFAAKARADKGTDAPESVA
ncbi:MAG TPA: hypothetical protein PLI13_10665 [Paracoccus sp. (in: a-proteobacteria)]|nr:hypothetical protein [Paracoccus sp. (in: a-proteobacteria)]